MFLGASYIQLTSINAHPVMKTALKVYIKPERIIGLQEMTGNATTDEEDAEALHENASKKSLAKAVSEVLHENASKKSLTKTVTKVVTVTQISCEDGVQYLVHETPAQIIQLLGQMLNHDINQMLSVKAQVNEAAARAIVPAAAVPPGLRVPGQ